MVIFCNAFMIQAAPVEEPVIKTASGGFAAQFAAQVAAVADVKKDNQPVVETKSDSAPGNKAADTPIQVFCRRSDGFETSRSSFKEFPPCSRGF